MPNGKLARFFENIKGKSVCLIGFGVSHRDLAAFFTVRGAKVSVCDRRPRENFEEAADLEAQGVTLHLGADYLSHLDADIIYRTPGLRFYTPELTEARRRGKIVTSEMETFFDLCPCPIIGVTGSDGKTTTTTLISEMLKAAGKTVRLGGNIGRALLPIIEEIQSGDFAVAELSSFQLISMRRSPDIAIVTNVSPNHLDMHKDMQEYIDAKRNIYLHQSAFSKAVLNEDNNITYSFKDDILCRIYTFSRKTIPERGAFLDGEGFLCFGESGEKTRLFHMDDIKIPGMHNAENYLAAISAVWGLVEISVMRKVAREFGGVAHRIEFIRELDGVQWYNDAIATSPARVVAGLNSFKQKIILIAGGYDKKIPFESLAPEIIKKVKALILIGAAADKIYQAVTSAAGFDPSALKIHRAASTGECVKIAREIARPGDIVSLSPACASFDMYKNFEARGEHFKRLVKALD
ncbi:MAG: UDP-N-acetylmuramoyl-L-alanine--D-glutamate ligase [Oscillospiraceae bacterium]|jgi:UDP-N-acetylmuramoylalanine--D-glutamate ligase|nr:UDP-N-acetylmuramoyl-L-alanine--D-glutamate ligase [Oscillospiraceae bacterium]